MPKPPARKKRPSKASTSQPTTADRIAANREILINARQSADSLYQSTPLSSEQEDERGTRSDDGDGAKEHASDKTNDVNNKPNEA